MSVNFSLVFPLCLFGYRFPALYAVCAISCWISIDECTLLPQQDPKVTLDSLQCLPLPSFCRWYYYQQATEAVKKKTNIFKCGAPCRGMCCMACATIPVAQFGLTVQKGFKAGQALVFGWALAQLVAGLTL